jgi:hypothetical protein
MVGQHVYIIGGLSDDVCVSAHAGSVMRRYKGSCKLANYLGSFRLQVQFLMGGVFFAFLNKTSVLW